MVVVVVVVVVGGDVVVVVVVVSVMVGKTRSEKSGGMNEVVEKAVGDVPFGGRMGFMRYTTFRPDGGPERERSWDFLLSWLIPGNGFNWEQKQNKIFLV